MIRTVLALLYLVLFLILELPVFGITFLIGKKDPDKAHLIDLHIVQWGFRCLEFISGVKLEVHGEENVPKDEAVMYVSNHRSFFDVILTYSRCPGLTGYIAKNNLEKVPLLPFYMKRVFCLMLDRNDIKQGLKTVLTAIDQVKNGISIFVYPEGTRCKAASSTEMLPFKEGSFKIAEKSGCKIVPVAITGTADVFENHFPWIKSRKVILSYGKPIETADMTREDKKMLGSMCAKQIKDMLTEHEKILSLN
ncbi:MAG: 1-acyl-sn-glycerol-3-phosphate acyltransferase [Lachnospiraceae bacterium]|nr:1-acyl-sn-glycerol-3-phosphate acyltransferase [Lachnospiraceae bacterium]